MSLPSEQDLLRGQRTDAAVRAALAALAERLLSGPSATAILEAWCVAHGHPISALVAQRVADATAPLGDDSIAAFALTAGESVRYRRVHLRCGTQTLSRADNWYVPARLTPEMNRLLDATELPFGRVVHALAPRRHNRALRMVWNGGPLEPEDPVFTLEAILTTGDGVPFCAVHETYLAAILAAPRRG